MSVIVIGGGPRAQVQTVNGKVVIIDETGILASGFTDEDDAKRYLNSMIVAEARHEDEHHDDPSQA